MVRQHAIRFFFLFFFLGSSVHAQQQVNGDALAAATSLEPKKLPAGSSFQMPTTSITPASSAQRATVTSALMKQPLRFVKNQGQFHTDQIGKRVEFYEQGKGQATYFTGDGVYLRLRKLKDALLEDEQKPGTPETGASVLVKLALIDSAESPDIIPERQQPGRVNYYLGRDSKGWISGIPTFGAVRYRNVYNGVDVRYYGNNSQLEYDVIVKPGAKFEQVRFSFEGIEGLQVAADGSLEIAVGGGKIFQKKPYIYQEIEGKRVEVNGGFKIVKAADGKFAYGFVVASYDKNHDLIIDPTLTFSTYLGGSSDDMAYGVATDTAGNVYIAGETSSVDFPTLYPAQEIIGGYPNSPDAFVAKVDASGALVYSTYLGSTGADIAYAIAVDGAGNAYITGKTQSIGFPVLNALQGTIAGGYDAFVSVLDSNGQLTYSSFLGGSSEDVGRSIAVDANGNVYVAGETWSANFPTTRALQPNFQGATDAFVTKMSAISTGPSLAYSTYLGGTGVDSAWGIAVDTAGDAYVTGETGSSNFPTANALQPAYGGDPSDAFITKISDAGPLPHLDYSTYIGGGGEDWGRAIAVDGAGSAAITGYTGSWDFPTSANAFQLSLAAGSRDAFVTKLDSTGAGLTYSTLLGGSGDDLGYGIAVDRGGNVYVTGPTTSADFPTLDPLQPVIGSALYDAFVTELDASGIPTFSTFLGGSLNDYGQAIAEDGSGHVFVVGMTQSTDFPTTTNPLQPSNFGGWDAFAARIDFGAPQLLSYTAETGFSGGLTPSSGTTATVFTFKVVYTDATGTSPSAANVCIDATCYAMALDTSGAANLWDGNYANGEQYVFSTTLTAGTHSYHFEASDGTTPMALPASGNLSGPAVVSLPVISPAVPYGAQGVPYTGALSISGGTGPYTWSATGLPAGFSIDPTTGVISGSSPVEGVYTVTVTVTDANGYTASQTITITINAYTTPPPPQVFDIIDLGTLGGQTSVAIAMNNSGQVVGYSGTAGGETHPFLWSNGVMTDLGLLGGTWGQASAINASGQVIGRINTASGAAHAFLYSNSVMTDIGTLGGAQTTAWAINNSGQVVGQSNTVSGATHAFLYSNGVMTDLGTLGGTDSVAYAINDSGQVVGFAYRGAPDYTFHAFLYSNGVMNDLGALASGSFSEAYAINNSGQVVGRSGTGSSGTYDAFLYSNDRMTDIGTFGGISLARFINSSGQAAGWSRTATGADHAFLYSNDTMTNLGTLGGPQSYPLAMNGSGQVVGNSSTVSGFRAFLYDNGSMKYILPSPSSPAWDGLDAAQAINDSGQIAGFGTINGATHAFVTVPSSSSADVAVTVSANPVTVAVGSSVTLTATITNNGPGSATNVAFSGLEYIVRSSSAVLVTPSQGTCSPVVAGTVGTPITCSLGSLASSASATITVVATLTFAAAPLPGNNSVGMIADVSATEPDATPANNHFYGAFNVHQPQADVAVTVATNPTNVLVDAPVTLTATITNNGPDAATSVAFTGLEYIVRMSSAVAVTPSQGTCSPVVAGTVGTPITCSLGTLASSASATITVVATLTAAAAPLPGNNSVGMIADVTATEPDPTAANNHFSGAFSARQPQADVAVTMSANPTTVNVGQPVTITTTVSNNGPDAATSVNLTLPWPVLTSQFANIQLAPSQGTCDAVVAGSPVTCSLGSLGSGSTATLTIVATPTAAVLPAGAATTTVGMYADVSATESDPNTANNHFPGNTQFPRAFSVRQPQADLAVTVAANPTTVNVGSPVTLTATVTNNGPDPATNVSFSGLEYIVHTSSAITVTAPQGTCPSNGATQWTAGVAGTPITCTFGTIAANASATITVVATLSAAAAPLPGNNSVGMVANVTATESDPTAANNNFSGAFNGHRIQADVGVTIAANPAAVNVGSLVTLTATITNDGPDPATNVSFTGFEYIVSAASGVTVTPAQGSCSAVTPGAAGTPISCTLGTIAPNSSVTIRVDTALTSAAPPLPGSSSAQMIADVTATEPDTNTSNNHFSGSFTVMAPNVSVSITLYDSSDAPTTTLTVPVGGSFTGMAAIHNAGGRTTNNAGFNMSLPDGLTFDSSYLTSHPVSQGFCSLLDARTLDCSTNSSLNAGGSFYIPFGVNVLYGAAGVGESVPKTLTATARAQYNINADPSTTATVTVQGLPAPNVRPSIIFDGPSGTSTTTLTVPVGGSFTGMAAIYNAGGRTTNNAGFNMSLPDGLTFDSSYLTSHPVSQGFCSLLDARTLDCSTNSSLNAGGSFYIPFGVNVLYGAAGVGESVPKTLTATARAQYNINANPSTTATVTVTHPPGWTHIGSNASVQPVNSAGILQPITLTFAGVTVAGISTAEPLASVPPLPVNFRIKGLAYNIVTTAQYTAPVTVCFSGTFEASDWLMHLENGIWVKLPNQQRLPVGGPPYSTICAQTQTLSPFVVATENRPPTANAGTNQTVDATGPTGASVNFSGSGSDPDGDPLTFSWSGLCGSASTAVATFTCPIGVSTMTLTVNDGRGGTASATVAITVLGAMDIKKSVLGDLAALRAKVTDKQDRDKLDDAIDSLTDSLNAGLWIDQTHIDSKHGDKVFDAEKECIGKLQELNKKKKTTIPGATLQAFINRITGADRLLALIAISDAQQRKVDTRQIALANGQVARGDAQAARGLSKEAIDFYRSAWSQVS